MKSAKRIKIGLVDADLLDNGTRHPNLVLLKLAGFLHDNHVRFELILSQSADITKYDLIYLSRVFTFTKMPQFYELANRKTKRKFCLGGTGFYADIENIEEYRAKREEDILCLKKDKFLNTLNNHRGGKQRKGIDMARQMPYYELYNQYIDNKVEAGSPRSKYKDYLKYSIGFLTRGCVRHCPFCINKTENKVKPFSKLEWFLDNETDAKGHLLRPYIYLWDDNFLASSYDVWKPLLQKLIDTGRPFQFRQGLDERMLAESPYGEEMAAMLSQSKYHGDFIFAFDNWKDREVIEKALAIWKRYNPTKGTKFYLFCGYKLTAGNHKHFYTDIQNLFSRIKLLMQYGCVGYVMRHADYKNYEIANLYVQIARWCNQQQFYKKMSFWEFCYRNQSYWEEHTLDITNRPKQKSFNDFMRDVENGYYGNGEKQVKMCLPLQTILKTLSQFPEHKNELLEMFSFKMENLVDSRKWEKVIDGKNRKQA